MHKQTLYIHVGAGKTGTSALQRFMKMNREKLEKLGVFIPLHGTTNFDHVIMHHKLSAHQATISEAISLWSLISEQGHQTTLVSSEFFHSTLSTSLGDTLFPEIQKVMRGYNIKIVFYIRKHSQWLQSAYSQWVKAEEMDLKFQEFLKRAKNSPPDQALKFANIFGDENVIVRPYEKGQFVGGNIFSDFINAIGLNWDSSFKTPEGNPNPRLTPVALEVKRRANSMFGKNTPIEWREDLILASQDENNKNQEIYANHSLAPDHIISGIDEAMSQKYEEIARRIMKRQDGVLFVEGSDQKSEKRLREITNSDIIDQLIRQNILLYKRLYDKS